MPTRRPQEPAIGEINNWPSLFGKGLHFTGPAGGTQGAQFAETTDGQKYVVKQYAGQDDRVWRPEVIANALYQAAGVNVPVGGVYHVDGKLSYVAKFVQGKPKKIKTKSEALGADFIVDAWLANWDVVGLDDDNIIWNANGVPYRVELGGTLGYRAMGAKKAFGHDPVEMTSMLEPGRQAERSMVINQILNQQKAVSLVQLVANGTVANIVNSSGLSPSAKAKLITTVDRACPRDRPEAQRPALLGGVCHCSRKARPAGSSTCPTKQSRSPPTNPTTRWRSTARAYPPSPTG